MINFMRILLSIVIIIVLIITRFTTLADTYPILIWLDLIALTFGFVYGFCRPIKRHIILLILIAIVLLEHSGISATFPILRLFEFIGVCVCIFINFKLNKKNLDNR